MPEKKPLKKIKLHKVDTDLMNRIGNDIYENMKSMFTAPQLTKKDIGKEIEGEGIYLGTCAPVNRDGVSLKKVFNVFAAPEDLPQRMTYNDTLEYLSNLKNWHGHDGTNHNDDISIYNGLKDGSYKGGWVIPPHELLIGTKVSSWADIRKRTIVQTDNLFDHKNKGALKNTFCIKLAGNADYSHSQWYCSSTKHPRQSHEMYHVRLSDGALFSFSRDDERVSCRPIRFVPI